MLARTYEFGFTLVEMSIVLVIIGLIVGSILVDKDLIRSAETRAQIAQIEKLYSAVNTFYSKYKAIPGDMNVTTATQFNFTIGANCDGTLGRRDGDGLLEGGCYSFNQAVNEPALFWQDLTSSVTGGLFPGNFPNSGYSIGCSIASATAVSGTSVSALFPSAKIGRGNYLLVYSTSGANWFGLEAITSTNAAGILYALTNIPVTQAYNMDKKMDDGIALSGDVQAVYINNSNSALQYPPTRQHPAARRPVALTLQATRTA